MTARHFAREGGPVEVMADQTSSYRILDYPVVIHAADPEAHAAVRSVFGGFLTREAPPGATTYRLARSERGVWHLDAGQRQVFASRSLQGALLNLEWRLVDDMLAVCLDGRFHLHGAALSTPAGDRSVLLLGQSGTGKTTLALALWARGFVPFADDLVFVDSETLVPVPFRRAFHVDDSSRALLDALSRAPAWRWEATPAGYFLPDRWAESAAPVRSILFPGIEAAATPRVTRLSLAEATARMLPFSLTLDREPDHALRVAAKLTEAAACYALRMGDLEATADLVAQTAAGD